MVVLDSSFRNAILLIFDQVCHLEIVLTRKSMITTGLYKYRRIIKESCKFTVNIYIMKLAINQANHTYFMP
jgi:hypothetical protein